MANTKLPESSNRYTSSIFNSEHSLHFNCDSQRGEPHAESYPGRQGQPRVGNHGRGFEIDDIRTIQEQILLDQHLHDELLLKRVDVQ
jgi:hypothetical protein